MASRPNRLVPVTVTPAIPPRPCPRRPSSGTRPARPKGACGIAPRPLTRASRASESGAYQGMGHCCVLPSLNRVGA
jgi:hypothetical protein